MCFSSIYGCWFSLFSATIRQSITANFKPYILLHAAPKKHSGISISLHARSICLCVY